MPIGSASILAEELMKCAIADVSFFYTLYCNSIPIISESSF